MGAFLNEFKAEFKKVVWPNRNTLVKQTTTVIMTSLLVAGVIFVMDSAFSVIYGAITNLLG